MPFLVKDLIEGRPRPMSCKLDEPAQAALAVMIEHDYSQMPVVDAEERPVGMVSSDSIVRALHYFDITLPALRVSHALMKVARHHLEDDLFELLDVLRDSYAVLIVDSDNKLAGIVTSYDATEYFRRRSEDIMLVEDVEMMVREYILAAFTDPNGELKQDELDAFVAETLSENNDLRGRFAKALSAYLAGESGTKPKLDQTLLNNAWQHIATKGKKRDFSDLTLANYVALLTRKDRWQFYQSTFGLEPNALYKVLDEVRKIRNGLAHFRGEISAQQRDMLRFCSEWLARHQPAPPAAQLVATPVIINTSIISSPEITQVPDVLNAEGTVQPQPALEEVQPPVVEETRSGGSRYEPLARYLQSQPADIDSIELSLTAIEEIIGDPLPPSARRHRAAWANDPTNKPQAQQWLDAGWRVSRVSLDDQRIVFTRNKEYERAYIAFFTELQAELERSSPGLFQYLPSEGRYWMGVGTIRVPNKGVAWFYCSFTRTRRFRVELYIDTHNQQTTKQLFDALQDRKEQIEAEVGDKLSWERLDDNRPSRIARYYPGTINDAPGALANLRARAVEAAKRFVPVLRRHLTDVIPDVLGSPVVEPVVETPR